ncbi:MAG: Asp-tRNA(Asn)/Glu-tRNA(Gln) amidotransferase subunit GatB [Candidatus Binatia bacterium]|nr:Asp-tRNA(Asn)/Glu-tRNA(Gln) amidotransferase subunit GatB [Candidatus Binatia bacterium]MDG2009019.1 Asp-tRNA(Asn)/Glu-tRNA(Gln) amidotransferase subunit GatB [Candidatus Binatia bacterium]
MNGDKQMDTAPGDPSSQRYGDWEPVIGLEVHAQLLTVSKLFCGCSTSFGAEPNAHTCPVCLGMPGVLPVLNRRAVELSVRTALATGCSLPETAIWSRKNYFYPDLPKGYQVSMYEEPLAVGGHLDVPLEGGTTRVRLTRIHMEEDAGKSIHDPQEAYSRVDLNRAGVPLMEIVSEPDIRSPKEAAEYMRTLRVLLQHIGSCDGNMEEGSMRCDANVSIRKRGTEQLGTRTEIKNMNSFRNIERAVDWEILRQIDLVEDGGSVVQQTRLWDADRERTESMRSKEDAHDYRYFPEPDLPPLRVEPEWIEAIRADLPELPAQRRDRFVRDYSLSAYDAAILTSRRDLGDYYEAAVAAHDNPKSIANWVMGDVQRIVRDRRLDDALVIEEWPVAATTLGNLVMRIDDQTISGKIAKNVFEQMLESGKDADQIIEEQGLRQVTDPGAIAAVVTSVIAAHPDKVEEYRGGKDKLIGFFVGLVMKETQGKANPKAVNEALRAQLAAPE